MINSIMRSYKILIAAFFTAAFLFVSCENDMQQVQNLNQKTIGVEVGKQIESYLSQDGKIKAKLMAPLMLRYQQ